MDSFQKQILCWGLCFVCLLFVVQRLCAAPDAETLKVVTKLEKIWAFQKNEIATAHIVYRHAYGQDLGEPHCKPLTPEQVSEVVHSVNYSDPQKAFQELVSRLYTNSDWITTANLYYHHSPLKSRLEIQVAEQNREHIKPGYKERLYVFDGKNSLVVNPLANQTDVYADTRGANPISRLRLATFFPTPQIRDLFTFQITDETLECRFENETEKLFKSVNIADGLVLDYHSFRKTGDLIGMDIFQRCFFTAPSGIVFPRIYLDVRYSEGKTVVVNLYCTEEASFNQPLSDDLFAVSLPKDARVWDNRYDEKKPAFTQLPESTKDVIRDGVDDFIDYNKPETTSYRLPVLIVINITAIAVVVWMYLWKRRKK